VNALDYGVPQDRERMILVGFRKTWALKNLKISRKKIDIFNNTLIGHYKNSAKNIDQGWFPWSKERKYDNVKKVFDWPTTNPFGSDVKKPKDLPEELMVGPLICNQNELRKLPNGEEAFNPYSKKFQIVLEGDVSKKCFKRLHRWRFSPAAAYGNNEVHLHPILPRRLSVREAMRIQTVPDSYAFPKKMSLSHKFKTIGNGVPVRLATALGKCFYAVLKGEINDNF
jgi:DNA (cytosine-5)-methyltransferase 1